MYFCHMKTGKVVCRGCCHCDKYRKGYVRRVREFKGLTKVASQVGVHWYTSPSLTHSLLGLYPAQLNQQFTSIPAFIRELSHPYGLNKGTDYVR